MYFSVVILVLTKALVTEVCHALNVTVTPGPVVLATENDNLTLSCLVSQRKRTTNVLILHWFFSPLTAPTPVPPASLPPNSPPVLDHPQFLIVKMGLRRRKLYGNYTYRFPQPKFHLHEKTEGEVYQLRILSVTGSDQGFYSCKVQEIRKHRDIWRITSNGTSTIQMTVHFTPEDGRSEGLWLLFADVYLCAVLICSLGLLSIFLFTFVLICQYFYRRHRLKSSYPLVKCPESSSGETVTSSSSCSSSSPSAQRRDMRQKTNRTQAVAPPKLPEEPPLHIPAKVPVAAKRPRKPRRLKTQPRRSATPRISQEESLTYAELELVRPRQEPPVPSTPDPTPSSPDTVYAQILFQEKYL
ncbi:V-set and transmembrane domain-containing protein 4a [Pundamilia nyererei]|uniref:V-set and transmembrane domain-containing protein 4a n=1 Tax=Pundamilia nyererei TaxID=303518 RepID=A0A9Y3VPX3_9CICH|nr:PREDICTED: V-set and transmembrane domain-containing protein 4 [Pundamilia nyererei]